MSVEPLGAPRDVDSISGITYWTTRGFWAVVDQALFAVSNLIINVLLARWLSPQEYGAFVTAYVVLILVGVAHGGLLIEPMPDRHAECAALRKRSRVVHAALSKRGASGTAKLEVRAAGEGEPEVAHLSTHELKGVYTKQYTQTTRVVRDLL